MGKGKANGYMYYVNLRRSQDVAKKLPAREDSHYGAEWAKLPDVEKKSYKERANASKYVHLASSHVTHIPVGAVGANDVSSDDAGCYTVDSEMESLVSQLVGDEPHKAAASKFALISTNVLVRTTEGQFIPVEVGVVTYSLKEGMISSYHRITDPGPVPIGYANKAETHRKDTHKIPDDCNLAIGRNNKPDEISNMLTEIFTIVSDCRVNYKGKDCFLFFSEQEMLPQVKGSMYSYVQQSGDKTLIQRWDQGYFVFLELGLLIMNLYAAVNVPMARPMCDDIPNEATYDYRAEGCKLHTEQDNDKCALSTCRRWCYLISDHLLLDYNITPLDGKHLPVSISFVTEENNDQNTGFWNTAPSNGPRFGRRGIGNAGDSHSTDYRSIADTSEAGSASNHRDTDSSVGFSDGRPVGGVGRGFRRN